MKSRKAASSSKKGGKANSSARSPLEFSDEEDSESEHGALSTGPSRGRGRGGRQTQQQEEYDSEEGSDDGSEEDESEEDDSDHHHPTRGRTLGGMNEPPRGYGGGGGASYLPSAYGGPPGGPEAALMAGGQHPRDRSVDRIRARSRDRRGSGAGVANRRDRSRSTSRQRGKPQPKTNERAAARRRERRADLEASMSGMSMGGDDVSINSNATDATRGSMSLINGMDSSFSQLPTGKGNKDITSTDYAISKRRAAPRTQSAKAAPTKGHDARLDSVLNRRRGGGGTRSASPSADTGKERRGGRR